MGSVTRVGIIICDRYRRCAGGKCFRSVKERVGAFSRYVDTEVEVVGFATCDGCPGGNIEYVGEELVANGAEVVHLATGMLVGYPPCPYIDTFRDFLEVQNGVEVVLGTHPIPEKYLKVHEELGTWEAPEWEERLAPTMTGEETRKAYD